MAARNCVTSIFRSGVTWGARSQSSRAVPSTEDGLSTSSRLHNSVLSTLGNTPVIRLNGMSPKGVDVFVKHESLNPLFSMKDRLSVGLIDWAEAHGKLKPGQTLVAALTGNTGMGLTVSCAQRGYPLIFVACENAHVEWRQLVRLLGGQVLITEEPEIVAQQLADKHGAFFTNRFQQQANPWIHEHTIAPEIFTALNGRLLDYFIMPHGTGGMLRGVGKVLRDRSPGTRICVVEQDSKPHPNYEVTVGPHWSWPNEILNGWTTEFAPTAIDAELKEKYIDEIISISGQEAVMIARELARSECILTGISGGALAAGALQVAHRLPAGSSVMTVLLDTSHFHFSTPLTAGVPEGMSKKEMELLKGVRVAGEAWRFSADVDGHL